MIRKTEKLTREYSKEFIKNILEEKLPFSCKIGGKSVTDSFGKAKKQGETYIRKALVSGVELTACYKIFDYAVEIGVTLKNSMSKNSPKISDINILDLLLPDAEPYKFGWNKRRVLYSVGSPSTIYDFEPREQDLARPDSLSLEETDGRSSTHFMPYFNCSSCDKEGVIAAIGWSGHWKADFKNGDGGMDIKLSFPADFYLCEREEISLPTVLLMPWKRENDSERELSDTFSLFRRIMLNFVMCPQAKKTTNTLRAWGGATPQEHQKKLANIKRFNIPCDAYGIDAGWYELDGNGVAGNWSSTLGDWHEAKDIHPNGLEWLSNEARNAGAKGFWLWFEFERTVGDSANFKAHPEHYFGGVAIGGAEWGKNVYFINMGDKNAREYMKNILYPIIKRVGITMFRVDFNVDPTDCFKAKDEADRNGVTELKYYNGLYTFFKDMLKDFPDLVIDNCASGGRRLDYRMCSLATPINCRSDYFTIEGANPAGFQAHTIGLSRWLPVSGDSGYSCTCYRDVPKSTYADRSVYGSHFALAAYQGDLSEQDGKMYQKIVNEARMVREYMSLDFYPLTGYSYSLHDWCAFMFADYDQSRALVMAFRRELNNSPEQIFKLKGLDENANYQVKNIDDNTEEIYSGKELLYGFKIRIPSAEDSRIILIKKCK